MFVGHLAVALAAKRAAPRVNLGWLIAGVTALDLLWPLFLLAGLEHVRIVPGAMPFTPLVFDSYPWSHSLVMAFIWGGALAWLARRYAAARAPGPLMVGLVVSHWVLDFVTHAPDMPLWPGPSPRFGLGLWNSIPGTFLVEGVLWIAAIYAYLSGRRFKTMRPRISFWSLVVVCTVMWAAGPWSPPPPDEKSLALFALIGWLIIPWAAAADRDARGSSTASAGDI